MKFFGVLCLFFCAVSIGQVSTYSSGGQTLYDFDIEGVKQTEHTVKGSRRIFSKVNLIGVNGYQSYYFEEGLPQVPTLSFVVEGEGEIEVTVKGAERATLDRPDFAVLPTMPPTPKLPGVRPMIAWNENFYERDEFFPVKRFEITEMGSKDGVLQRLVTVFPFAYNPATGEYDLYKKVQVNFLRSWNWSESRFSNTKTIAFVVGPNFVNSPLVEKYKHFKEALGFNVIRLDLKGSYGTADAVRESLQKIYRRKDLNIDYVLIFGDVDQVPGYDSSRVQGLTDYYYASLDEPDYQKDITAPDAIVGRFSATNEKDLEVMVHNSMRYSAGSFKDTSWLKKASTIASDDGYWWPVAEGTMWYLVLNYLNDERYAGTFPKRRLGGDLLFAVSQRATTSDLLKAFNEGRGFITYGGHGNTETWNGPEFTADDVKAIKHPEALPFVSSHACYTGHFVGNSFAEEWQRHKNGSIVFWGGTDSDYWNEGEYSQRRFYDAIFAKEEKSFGAIAQHSRIKTYQHYGRFWYGKFYLELYNIFGDPSVEFRRDEPKKAVIVGPALVKKDTKKLSYRVESAKGIGLDGVRVGLISEKGDFRELKETDANGEVTFEFGSHLGRVFHFTVSGQKVKLVQKQVWVE